MTKDDQIIQQALQILADRTAIEGDVISNPQNAAKLAQLRIGGSEREVFAIIHLNNANAVIEFEELFYGTINAATVYPREVARSALLKNSAAVIFAHNHPSGATLPSEADKAITAKLKQALGLFEIRVLDHLIVSGNSTTSFSQLGLI